MNKAQTSLRWRVAVALGNATQMADPEDIAVVWKLRELAAMKPDNAFDDALGYATDFSGREWDTWRLSCATKEQIRTASLSVIHGVSVEEVRTWG